MRIIAAVVVAFAMLAAPEGFAAASEAAQATAPQTQASPIAPTDNRNDSPSDSELLTFAAAFVLMVAIAFGGAARRDLLWRLPLALLSFVALVFVANAAVALIAVAAYYFVFRYDDAKDE